MSNEWVRRCLIVPAVYAPLARALCKGLAPGDSGKGMFAVPLSPIGSPPATYFITHGMIKEDFDSLLPFTSFDAEGVSATQAGQPEVIVELSNGTVTLAQVNDLLSAIDVSEQDPFVAMQRLGLKLIQEEL
jgi:hypothetical protein